MEPSQIIIVVICAIVAVGGIIVLIKRNFKPKNKAVAAPRKAAAPVAGPRNPAAGSGTGPARRSYGAGSTDTQPTRRQRGDS